MQIEGSIYNRTLSSFKSKRPETSINEMSKTNYKRIKTGHNSRRNFLMKNLPTFPLMVFELLSFIFFIDFVLGFIDVLKNIQTN